MTRVGTNRIIIILSLHSNRSVLLHFLFRYDICENFLGFSFFCSHCGFVT